MNAFNADEYFWFGFLDIVIHSMQIYGIFHFEKTLWKTFVSQEQSPKGLEHPKNGFSNINNWMSWFVQWNKTISTIANI